MNKRWSRGEEGSLRLKQWEGGGWRSVSWSGVRSGRVCLDDVRGLCLPGDAVAASGDSRRSGDVLVDR